MLALLARCTDERFGLTEGLIDVWHLEVARTGDMTELTELLDAREHTRSTRLRNQNDRTHFIIAHAFARILLGRYLGCAPKAVRIGYGPNGKPHAIRSCGAPDVRFNTSRSGQACGIHVRTGG